MLTEAMYLSLYGAIFLSLFVIDYALGKGFVDMFQKYICKFACFIQKTIREEAAKHIDINTPISLPLLFIEIIILSITIAFLKRYKQIRGKDRIDELLQESNDALRQTNEFLEKWRMRRINWQENAEYSYLDDEPLEIKPLNLEVPILHMAIIDTRGTTRSQPERGDAGDTIHFTDSTLLSVTSLIDEEFDVMAETKSNENLVEETHNVEFQNRFLWDVMEEDSSVLED